MFPLARNWFRNGQVTKFWLQNLEEGLCVTSKRGLPPALERSSSWYWKPLYEEEKNWLQDEEVSVACKAGI